MRRSKTEAPGPRSATRPPGPPGRPSARPGLLVIALGAALAGAALADTTPCAGLLRVVEAAGSAFQALRETDNGDRGTVDASFGLAGASGCRISADEASASYRCTREYALGERRAHDDFRLAVERVRLCLGDDAEETVDSPVNHPDSFLSHYFRLPGAEVRVSLKHKSGLGRTLVSVGVDAAASPR